MDRKNFNRVRRAQPITDEQAARDAENRRKIVAEFPLAQPPLPERGELSDAIRNAIEVSGKSIQQICEEAGISPIAVARFLAGKRDINLATADRLAKLFGLAMESRT